MYLKSLVLKGFKSFADRTVLNLEPGITAVVGPNGSGKSNISDAVLWVLGERNAKNLRGSVMEDVIFAGSSARKSVRVAEVSLVLDNSDGSLPVDYDEVAITRRMYHNGESDYLINGTIARRMDVLDILHDSGLGTGTNSIISQGHLDSILASKPEDRRVLIEEAAGILKHKQRKAKTYRKLAKMDESLARVNDVVAEVERQLAPLKRKAKKAQQYTEAKARLDEVCLDLAVDDLRLLQREWDDTLEREGKLSDDAQQAQQKSATARSEYEAVQESLRKESAHIATLADRQARATTLVERLEATSRMLGEKGRAASQRADELNASLEENRRRRETLAAQREQAAAALDGVRAQCAQANERLTAAQTAYDEAHRARLTAESESHELARKRNAIQRELDGARRELGKLQEKLAGALGRVQAADSVTAGFDERVATTQQACQVASEAAEKAALDMSAAQERQAQAREAACQAEAALDAARAQSQDAQAEVARIQAGIAALEEVERAAGAAAGPARQWLIENAPKEAGTLTCLMEHLRVDAGFESLVETLLGHDATALVAAGSDAAAAAARALRDADKDGSVSLVLGADSGRQLLVQDARAAAAKAARNGAASGSVWALADRLQGEDGFRDALMALLGDVVVCPTVEVALACHRADDSGLRFATSAGTIVWPNGKISLGNQAMPAAKGSLQRRRQLSDMRDALVKAQDDYETAQAGAQEASHRAADAQKESLAASERLASLRGAKESAEAELRGAQRRVREAEGERSASQQRFAQAHKLVESTQPQVDALSSQVEQLESQLQSAKDRAYEAQRAIDPARALESTRSRELADARMEQSRLAQQETYDARAVEQQASEMVSIGRAESQALSRLDVLSLVQRRTGPLAQTLQALSEEAHRHRQMLTDQVSAAQEATFGANDRATAAGDAFTAAQEASEAVREQLAALREEKAALRVRVQAAADFIADDMGHALETALELPRLADRTAAEEERGRLERRIANMGTINPDAAAEYDQTRERLDFLRSQLDDLSDARASLRKIDRVIEARMKDDFLSTFDQVNEYFGQIFAELFPGGSATLSLTDPENVDTTGVEVSAQPRGKRITKMMLMSGGEKSLVACALLFAVYRTRATPFYILDEIEAALDDLNLQRLAGYLSNLRNTTQLIMITHQRRTMEMADVLFGVSMQGDGVTKVISQRLERALKYAE